MIELSKLKPREDNPRTITEYDIEELKRSIEEDKWMLGYRMIVVDEGWNILGGNQRYTILKDHLGYEEVPEEWVFKMKGLTEEQKKEFIVKDNTHSGEWDFAKMEELAEDRKKELAKQGVPIWIDDVYDEDGFYDNVGETDKEGEEEPEEEEEPKFQMLQIEFEPEDYEQARELVKEARENNFNFTDAIKQIVNEYGEEEE